MRRRLAHIPPSPRLGGAGTCVMLVHSVHPGNRECHSLVRRVPSIILPLSLGAFLGQQLNKKKPESLSILRSHVRRIPRRRHNSAIHDCGQGHQRLGGGQETGGEALPPWRHTTRNWRKRECCSMRLDCNQLRRAGASSTQVKNAP